MTKAEPFAHKINQKVPTRHEALITFVTGLNLKGSPKFIKGQIFTGCNDGFCGIMVLVFLVSTWEPQRPPSPWSHLSLLIACRPQAAQTWKCSISRSARKNLISCTQSAYKIITGMIIHHHF